MKKSTGVVGVVVVLAVAYLGATWYVGKQAQATIERVVAQANARLAKMLGPDHGSSGVKMAITDYQRHFFSSQVDYAVQMKDLDGKPMEIKMRDQLQHGPFPLNALRAGNLAPMLVYGKSQLVATPATQKWFDSQKGKSPLQIETRVGFGGAGVSVWTFLPTEIANDGETLSFSGGLVQMQFSNDFNDNTAQGKFDSFALVNKKSGENLAIKNIQANSKTTVSNETDGVTQTSATIDSFTVGDSTESTVSIDKLSVKMDSRQKDKLLDGSVLYELGRMVVGNIDLGSVSVGIKARQLDMAAFTALGSEFDAMQAKRRAANEPEMPFTDAEEAILREKLVAVLAANPSLSIDPILWKNAKGESKAGLLADFSSPANPQEENVQVLLSEALKRVKLDLSLSKPMFIQAFGQSQSDPQQKQQMEMVGAMLYDQYIARLRDAGLVKVDGDTAAAAVVYEKDSVNLNGQTMPVSEFMQRAMGVVM